MNTLDKALNKGVPSAIDIPIPFSDIIELSSNKERTITKLGEALKLFDNACAEKAKCSCKFFYTNKQALISTDPKTFTKTLSISPNYIINMITMNLDVGKISEKLARGEVVQTPYPTKEEIEERLVRLGQVTKEKELKREFPSLYMSYEETINAKARLEIAKKHSFFEYMALVQKLGFNQYDIQMLDEIKTFKDYIKFAQKNLRSLYEHEEELSEIAFNQKIDARVFGINTSKKLELYLADLMTEIARCETSSPDIKQKCSYFLSAYLFENQDSLDDGITVNRMITNYDDLYEVEKVTKRSVYNKYRQVLIENPALFNINLDYHMFDDMEQSEIDALMASYLETLQLQWEIIPDGEEINLPPELDDPKPTIHVVGPDGNPKPPKKKKTSEELKEQFYEKKQFFDSTEPLLRVMGKDTFNGYIGYIYPSGKVILDKYYESSESKQLADEVAIYCMDIDDFYRLSQLSKSEIIRDRLCKRFYHRGDWQQRVTKEISTAPQNNISSKLHVLRKLDTKNQE